MPPSCDGHLGLELGERACFDLVLENVANLVEIIAKTLSSQTPAQESATFFVSSASGLPCTLFYPPDGLMLSIPDIPLFGDVCPEAVVEVNRTAVASTAWGSPRPLSPRMRAEI